MTLCRKKSLTEAGIVRIRQLVLEAEVNVNCVSTHSSDSASTPLLLLCYHNRSESLYKCLKYFLEREHTDLQMTNSHGHSALTLLCRFYTHHDLIHHVRLLSSFGIDVAIKERNGRIALNLLCQYYTGDDLMDIARFLLSKRIDRQSLDRAVMTLRSRHLRRDSEILSQIVQYLNDSDRKPNRVSAYNFKQLVSTS